MYLKYVQVSGFKSFRDFTKIPIRGNLNAVVGPNGCGKSNIVDAIRWVIGEISAKQLRSQSMNDVIFNGTSTSKPVGKASVELLFDNSDGRVGGEYAKFSEISIRREVERDGQSAYFLNNIHVRRRDIIDIFLGTGLGPDSYAIIEQGMISRLIEAKPEDLRVYIEEAAGISKYKERRRETENRIRHTQENLERLNDIQQELEKQLRHLKRQANAAERYQIYRQEEQLITAQLKVLQWHSLNQKTAEYEQQINQELLLQDETIAHLRSLETHIERIKQVQIEITDEHNLVQKSYYSLGSEISRIEQQILTREEQKQQWQHELDEVSNLWQELTEHMAECNLQVEELESEVIALKPQILETDAEFKKAQVILQEAEQNMLAWETSWQTFQDESAKNNSQADVLTTKIENFKRILQELNQSREQINYQMSTLSSSELADSITPLSMQLQQLQQDLSNTQDTLQILMEKINLQKQNNQEIQQEVKNKQHEIQEKSAKLLSLQALQEAVLVGDDNSTKSWLENYRLETTSRLAHELQVERGWELAVETVLQGYMESICVENDSPYVLAFKELSQGQVTIVSRSHDTITDENGSRTQNEFHPLASLVKTNWPIYHWLNKIYCTANIDEAEKMREKLQAEESIITKDGIWLGKNWIRICKKGDENSSVLIRAQHIKELQDEISILEKEFDELNKKYQVGEEQLYHLETAREAAHYAYQKISSELTEVQSNLRDKQARFESENQQAIQLQSRLLECEKRMEDTAKELESANILYTNVQEQRNKDLDQKEQLLSKKDIYRHSLDLQRDLVQNQKQQLDECEVRLASNENQLVVLRQTLLREERQLQQATERRELLLDNLSEAANESFTLLQDELQEKLQQRLVLETELRQIEDKVTQYQQDLKTSESEKHSIQQKLNQFQSTLENFRMERQTLLVRQTTMIEQLQELGFDLDTIRAEMPADANLELWEENRLQVLQRIERLGPINLAAIDECKTTLERKEYLDKQSNDLMEALNLLQDAIRKIDKETRSKFRDTFDQVNLKFNSLYPQIFGGGNGNLELSEEDVLTAGVIVRAQPPGKRNSTIHMLSGGEKALTAIALVFSLFHLNPAPFCILDEVDAPLDDLNVSRFCQLVKEMAKDTQFLVISHNKVSIEMADYLMGVTMQEAGVSRLVAVDVKEAIEMVA